MTYVVANLTEGFPQTLVGKMQRNYRENFRMKIPGDCGEEFDVYIYDFDGESVILTPGSGKGSLSLITPETDKKNIEKKLNEIGSKINEKFRISEIK